MKIVFTGSGTGGHFYPIIAVAEAVNQIAAERQLVTPQLYQFAPDPFDQEALFANNIEFVQIPAGKTRRYFSMQNFTDIFVTLSGFFRAWLKLLKLYPDVVFSKGGYTSVPVVLAAHYLGIPIVIHESDSRMGRANKLASKYAYRIGVAFDSAAQDLRDKDLGKVARVGIPVRKDLQLPEKEGAKQLLGLDPSVPTILIVGGSLGSKRINDTALAGLNDLVSSVNVIHQTGKTNFDDVQKEASVILDQNGHKSRYHVFPYLSADALRQAAGAADLVISRAGAGSINEISYWRKPAILIPIPENVSHDQRSNAYAYAHLGAAVVLEEANLSPHVLVSEVRRITGDAQLAAEMGQKGAAFGSADAARVIAEELIAICLSHETPQEAGNAEKAGK